MRKYIFISLGGAFGAVLRYVIRSIPTPCYNGNIPLNTLIINIIGSFILALVLTGANEVFKLEADLKLGITTGFIGAFTTFSTLCKETVSLLSNGAYLSAFSYLTLSAILGITAAYLGVVLESAAANIVNKNKKNIKNTVDAKEE
ncbi:fluoride efflux transporter CrcB [Anaerocolumna sedimenticola]|uniref:Fluoride-specific ion channel FluC n=1 Tax=Anaerocolumna sedimenticola TaxID=2696063 RepID=A0A6P1TIL7_9FIRM|nr:fluoride efflux transporter CrcB [Anaerocolumna sedimenticola]QHQ59475.1 fluoride efflux transporter CrcB [Anaerocolumna sedimenticola]